MRIPNSLFFLLHCTQLFLLVGEGEACVTACGISVHQSGITPLPPAVEAGSLNHCTARGVPGQGFDPGLPLVRRAPSTLLLRPEPETSGPVGGGCGVTRGRCEPRGKTGTPAAAQGRASVSQRLGGRQAGPSPSSRTVSPCGPLRPGTQPLPTTASPAPSTAWAR